MPNGHIGCLTLTLRKKILVFEIFGSTLSCPSFSRQMKINSLFYQKTQIRIAGKTDKNQARLQLLFAILLKSTIRVELTSSS